MIKDAVILMAGIGSRLSEIRKDVPKPLIQIAGRPVFSYTIDALERAGVETVHVITGYNSEPLLAGLKPLIPAGMTLHAIHNPEWQKQNGVSVLAAKPHLLSPFLLTMGDHLFGAQIVELTIKDADSRLLNVAVDRKLDTIFDLDDAMKVKTSGDRVVSIGKDLNEYDAIDTASLSAPPNSSITSSKRNPARRGRLQFGRRSAGNGGRWESARHRYPRRLVAGHRHTGNVSGGGERARRFRPSLHGRFGHAMKGSRSRGSKEKEGARPNPVIPPQPQ